MLISEWKMYCSKRDSISLTATCLLVICRNVQPNDSVQLCCRSKDGRMLVVSSMDGYCSVVTFDAGELGVPYTPRPASSVSLETRTSNNPKVIVLYMFVPRRVFCWPLGYFVLPVIWTCHLIYLKKNEKKMKKGNRSNLELFLSSVSEDLDISFGEILRWLKWTLF